MKRQQSGFTLIELITVVVILGVLAAFAIPRFASLEKEARIGALKGLAGGARSGAALAHAKWIAGGNPTTVDMEGVTGITLTNGYPTADAAGIQKTLQDTTGFTAAAASSDWAWTLDGAPTPANCKVVYSASSGAGVLPAIVITDSGC